MGMNLKLSAAAAVLMFTVFGLTLPLNGATQQYAEVYAEVPDIYAETELPDTHGQQKKVYGNFALAPKLHEKKRQNNFNPLNTSKEEGWKFHQTGMEFYQKHQFKNAINSLSKAVKELGYDDQNKAMSFYVMGCAYYQLILGTKDKTEIQRYATNIIDSFSQALILKGNNTLTDAQNRDTLFLRGYAYFVKEEYKKAISDFEKAIAVFGSPPENKAESYHFIAMANEKLGEADIMRYPAYAQNACNAYSAVIKINPNHPFKDEISEKIKQFDLLKATLKPKQHMPSDSNRPRSLTRVGSQ